LTAAGVTGMKGKKKYITGDIENGKTYAVHVESMERR